MRTSGRQVLAKQLAHHNFVQCSGCYRAAAAIRAGGLLFGHVMQVMWLPFLALSSLLGTL